MKTLKSFIAGFTDFKKVFHNGSDSLYASLQRRQDPSAMIIACCDSRVDPALLLGCAPGDIFVVRNVANLVPHITNAAPQDSTIAALTYGVMHLNIRDIVVLGHSNCGGIRALCSCQTQTAHSPLGDWLEVARPALELARKRFPGLSHEDLVEACQKVSLLLSMDNLLSWPWIRDRVEQGVLKLHPWFFDMELGDLLHFSKKNRKFEMLQHQDPDRLPDMDYGASSFYSQPGYNRIGMTIPA